MIDAAHSPSASSAHPDCPDCHQPLPSSHLAQCPHCGHAMAAPAPAKPARRWLRGLFIGFATVMLLAAGAVAVGWALASWLGHPVAPRNEVVALPDKAPDTPEPLAPTGAQVHPTLSRVEPVRPREASSPTVASPPGSAAAEASAALDELPAETAVAAAPAPAPAAAPRPRKSPAPAVAAAPKPLSPAVAAVPSEVQFLMEQQLQPTASQPN